MQLKEVTANKQPSKIGKTEEPETPEATEESLKLKANMVSEGDEDLEFEDLKDGLATEIPETIYKELPSFVQSFVALFPNKQGKEMALLSLLAIFSGCLRKIEGVYNRKDYHLNIFLVIPGPAGAGKADVQWGRQVVEKVEARYEEKSKMLFFPPDTSFAALIKGLKANNGEGILFSSEIDSLTQNFTKEWGNISPLLRQAAEHEKYENMRAGVDEPEVSILHKPALTLLLTGTPKQVLSLIKDTEDGLFSRICFFNIEMEPEWKDVFPKSEDGATTVSIDKALDNLKQQALEIFLAYDERPEKSISFELSAKQSKFLNEHFSRLSTIYFDDGKKNTIATIRRLGLVCFRLAGILTAIRQYERKPCKLTCSDEDFRTAIILSNVFLANSQDVASGLPNSSERFLSGNKRKFYDALPVNIHFSKAEAVAIASELSITESSVESYLKKLQPIFLKKPTYNQYLKKAKK